MNIVTEKAVMSMLAADDSITETAAQNALAILRGGAVAPENAVMTRKEVAAMLRVNLPTVSVWARQGVIKRVRMSGRRKSLGYSRQSVMAILNGDDGRETISPKARKNNRRKA